MSTLTLTIDVSLRRIINYSDGGWTFWVLRIEVLFSLLYWEWVYQVQSESSSYSIASTGFWVFTLSISCFLTPVKLALAYTHKLHSLAHIFGQLLELSYVASSAEWPETLRDSLMVSCCNYLWNSERTSSGVLPCYPGSSFNDCPLVSTSISDKRRAKFQSHFVLFHLLVCQEVGLGGHTLNKQLFTLQMGQNGLIQSTRIKDIKRLLLNLMKCPAKRSKCPAKFKTTLCTWQCWKFCVHQGYQSLLRATWFLSQVARRTTAGL